MGEILVKPNAENHIMRTYLLGILPVELRPDLEERILTERQAYEELLITEDELIDQYIAGSLDEKELKSFELNFLITAERQQKVRFGRVFRRYLNSVPTLARREGSTKQLSDSWRLLNPFGITSWAFRLNPLLAFCLTVTVILAACATAFIYQRIRSRQPPQQILAVALVSGSTRSEGTVQRVPAPPAGAAIKFQLEFKTGDYHHYKAELFKEDESLKTVDKLAPEAKEDHEFVSVTVPGELLKPADYEIKLTGISEFGQSESVGRFPFRVVTK
jgi:hypothetical protein